MQVGRNFIDIDKGISFGMSSGAVIEITKKGTEPDSISTQQKSAWPWAIWGKSNNYPQEILDANMQDSTSASALDFKIKAHYGKGLYFFRESINAEGTEIKTPMLITQLPQEMQDFYYRNDIANLALGIIQDYEWWNFYYVQYLINKAGNKIIGMKWQRTKDVRSSKRGDYGDIPSFHLSAYWPKPKAHQVIEVPVFNKRHPFDSNVQNGIYKHQLVSVDKDYYPTAKWQSNTKWLGVSTKIAQWIDANIDNSVNIKYHIEIPEQYFIDLYPEKNYTSRAECLKLRLAAEIQIKENIDECLTGAENVSKIFYTKFAVDPNGNVRPGWKINVLENKVNDTAWLSADATAASRITSAHAVDPTLSGLRTGNSLQVGSGSDMREKFNFYLQLHTTIGRQITTEWFEIVSRANKWPSDIRIGYRDVFLETTDKAKTGVKVEHEESPTAKAAA